MNVRVELLMGSVKGKKREKDFEAICLPEIFRY